MGADTYEEGGTTFIRTLRRGTVVVATVRPQRPGMAPYTVVGEVESSSYASISRGPGYYVTGYGGSPSWRVSVDDVAEAPGLDLRNAAIVQGDAAYLAGLDFRHAPHGAVLRSDHDFALAVNISPTDPYLPIARTWYDETNARLQRERGGDA